MEKITIDPKNLNQTDFSKAADALRRGEVIAFPTETVYGIAARADSKKATEKLYRLKQRLAAKPFSIAVSDPNKAAKDYFYNLIPFGWRLVEKFWPGPLTIIYYQKEEEKIGIRVPSGAVAEKILKQVDFPVYLPSANRSGQREAVTAAEVESIFGDEIDLILDGGPARDKTASTVVDLTVKPFKILRQGLISENEIAKVFIKKRIVFVCTGNTCRSPLAEYLFRNWLRKQKGPLCQRYEVISAGIAARPGSRASLNSSKLIKEKEGIDLAEFSSRQLTQVIVLSSDYIFTMEKAQKDYIIENFPSAQARVFNLSKFIFPDIDNIADPAGQSLDFYQKVYDLIDKAALELTNWL